MLLLLAERQAVVRELARQSRRATTRAIPDLNQVQRLCDDNRSYAAPEDGGKCPPHCLAPGRGRKARYGAAVKTALFRCWAILSFPKGEALQPFLPTLVAQLATRTA